MGEESSSDLDRRSRPPERWTRVVSAGAAPGIEPHELTLRASSEEGVRVTCIDYCVDRVQVLEVDDLAGFLATHRPAWSHVRWINIDGLTNMEVIRAFAEKYELHPLAIEDVIDLGQRPKAEDYPASEEHPGRLFVVAEMVELVEERLRGDQLSFFLGRNTLISFQESPNPIFAPIVQRIKTKGSRLRMSDVSFLLYCLLDALVDRFFPVLETISAQLEELEDSVFRGESRDVLPDVHKVNRNLSLMRRVAWPMRELISVLVRDQHECLSETTRTYLRDVYDHLVQVLDLIETYRDFVGSLSEVYLSSVSKRMNDIMRTLTIISTIFVPLTFLAGVYGMNMPIPENQNAWTYPLFWLFSISVALVMLFGFRRRGWLQ